jgi:RNA 2',3'-cyclic 3'-phosphodiesterase
MAGIRTFISLHPTEAIQTLMAAALRQMSSAAPDVKWEQENKLHATIKFLGDVAEPAMPSVLNAVERAVRETHPFSVTFRGVGAFPGGELAAVKERLDAALAPFGYPAEARAFHPHVTLGRVKDQRSAGHLTSMLENRNFDPQSMMVDSLFVMKSLLRPQGAEYSVLRQITLQP